MEENNGKEKEIEKPDWFKVSYDSGVGEVAKMMEDNALHTVCKEANCPNRGECYKKRKVTYMIMGNQCSRNCKFCNVTNGVPTKLDENEPLRVAESAKKLNLKHVVVTSVTRDDLEDGGANHFAKTITEIRRLNPDTTIEVLIPDLKGEPKNLDIVIAAKPDVINHNMETVKRLYEKVRPEAEYERSLFVLKYVKENAPDILTKTGIMVGLGETDEEVYKLMDDVLAVDCDIFTIGQYLQPTRKHVDVEEYVSLEKFDEYKKVGEEKGFKFIASSPLVRSSYKAAEALEAHIAKTKEEK